MRIFVLGNCPLPTENSKSRPAAGLRSYQFISGLKKNPEIQLKVVCIGMPECYGGTNPDYGEVNEGGVAFNRISKDDIDLTQKIQVLHDGFKPDCIVSINTFPSYVAAQLDCETPLWADLNGWVMAEAQAQAFKMDSNDYLPHYAIMQKLILQRADKISTVSQAQKLAVIGELAGLGRLSKETFNYELVHDIPNATSWFEGEREDEGVYAIPGLPDEAFTALWMGGYNTWADEKTLFESVSNAMESCEKLYFVSTGGSIEGLDNETFENFRKMIETSPYKDRFIFLGWLKTIDIPKLYRRVHIGLNIDRKCIETLTGARNRINEMMKFGLPIITTAGSEISYEVARVNAGLVLRSGDSMAISEAIKSLYNQWTIKPRPFSDFSKNGQKYIEEECNYEVTTRTLRNWCKNPKAAPDRGTRIDFSRLGSARAALKYLKQGGIKRFSKKLWQRIR
jgi:glycosyltransferase involved in cell wall biosynthesis